GSTSGASMTRFSRSGQCLSMCSNIKCMFGFGGNRKLGPRECVLRLDLEAIPLDVDNPDALPNCGGTASGRPDAIADPHAPAVRVDRLGYDDDLAQKPADAIVEQRIAAVIVAIGVGVAPADFRRQEGESRE